MANSPIHDFSLASPPLLTDELAAARSPYGIGDDAKHTPQTILDSIDILASAAPLDGTERTAVIQGGVAVASTISQITLIKSVADKLFLAQNYF